MSQETTPWFNTVRDGQPLEHRPGVYKTSGRKNARKTFWRRYEAGWWSVPCATFEYAQTAPISIHYLPPLWWQGTTG
jgi:hypothetical protein